MNTTEPTSEGSKGVELFVRCRCGCHGTPGMIHFQACCEGSGRGPGFTRAYETEWGHAACLAALKELTVIAEFLQSEYPLDFEYYFTNGKSAIERAKLLTSK